MNKVVELTGREQMLVVDALKKAQGVAILEAARATDPHFSSLRRGVARELETIINNIKHADLA